MREKQTTCQNQLAEGDVGNTHTHIHTHTSLLVMSQRKRRYSTSRSASWCPHPTLICTWATTPWLPPFVAVFCYHCCVLHCAQWLCRYAPIHVVVVLCCVCGGEREEREQREREAINTTSVTTKPCKQRRVHRKGKEERRLSQNGKQPENEQE